MKIKKRKLTLKEEEVEYKVGPIDVRGVLYIGLQYLTPVKNLK